MAIFRINVGLSWAGEGGPGVNTWHFRDSGGPLQGEDVEGAMQALKDFYTGCIGIYSNDVVVTAPAEVIQDPYGAPEYFATTGWTLAGQGGGGKAPPATAAVVGWRTASATRSGRGRTFLSPITTAAIDANGTIGPTQLAALQSAANALVAWGDDEAVNGAFGVWSPTQSLFRDFTGARVRDRWAVLTSRRD